jgi:hypothetical protein
LSILHPSLYSCFGLTELTFQKGPSMTGSRAAPTSSMAKIIFFGISNSEPNSGPISRVSVRSFNKTPRRLSLVFPKVSRTSTCWPTHDSKALCMSPSWMFLTWEDAAWVLASPKNTVKNYSWPSVAQSYQAILARVPNRNEQLNLQKRTYLVGTEAPLSQESGQRYQKSYTPRLGPILMVLRLAGLAGSGNRSVLDRYRPSMNTNLRRSKGTGCRCRARRGAKIERPNRGSLSGNQITCGRNSVKIRS